MNLALVKDHELGFHTEEPNFACDLCTHAEPRHVTAYVEGLEEGLEEALTKLEWARLVGRRLIDRAYQAKNLPGELYNLIDALDAALED